MLRLILVRFGSGVVASVAVSLSHMMNRIMTTGTALAALAATAFLTLPANAADRNSKNDRGNRFVERTVATNLNGPAHINVNKAQRINYGPNPRAYSRAMQACSYKAVKRAWNKGAWSAQFTGTPRLAKTGPRQWKLVGNVRTISENGIRDRRMRCDVQRGEVVSYRRAGKRNVNYRY